MELINNLMSDHLMHSIGWTIIHSIWQASFVALIMSIYLNRYQKEKSIVRYRIALSSLYIMLGLSILTFCIHYFNPGAHGSHIVHSAGTIDISGMSGSHYIQDLTFGLVHHFDFITTMWITGMLVFAFKFIGGYAMIKRYELSGQEILNSEIHVILNDLLDKMNLDKSVQVLESAKVYTPMMLGHLKPVILLPLGILNQLELNEVEAILAHELSHISRNDFLQNMLQSFIEIIYYYHPAIWWISANVRAERENCCDEEAVRLCGSAVNYAKALVKVEEMQSRSIPALAIPMARNKNNLLNRVRRILHQPQNKSQIKEKLMATIMLFSIFTVFGESNASILNNDKFEAGISVYTSDNGHFEVSVQEQENCNCPAEETNLNLVKTIVIDSEDSHLVIDTIPQDDCNCNDVTIESNTNNRSFKLKIDNGVIKEFKINGEEVDDATKYFKLGENGKIIKTEDGQILLKEFNTDFDLGKDEKYRSYDLDALEEDKVLKAPFKIGGAKNGKMPNDDNEENLARILEKISRSKHITKDQMDRMKSWSWSSSDEGLMTQESINELIESLAHGDFHWPSGHNSTKWSENPDGSFYLSAPDIHQLPLDITATPKESFIVKAGNEILKEGVDYFVDNANGKVKIINEVYLKSGEPISVSFEEKSHLGSIDWPQHIESPIINFKLAKKFPFPMNPIVPTPPNFKSNKGPSFFNSKPSSRIFRALLSDGLIQPEEENILELTDKYLKVNGEKQPTNIWKKYKKIYESQLGHELMEGSKIKLKEQTKARSRFSSGFSWSES